MVMFRRRESGAVSLFVVIFAMLLITVVTLSFLRLMLRDQQQASTSDLSQSAYDSSLAGVEDGKRALIYYRTVCASGDTAACTIARNTINNTTCNQGLVNVVTVPNGSGEVQVQQQQSANDTALNQAYTCVLMQLDTDDYLGTLSANSSRIVPLISTGPYTQVQVEWFTTEDFGTTGSSVNLEAKPPQTDSGSTNQNIWPLLAQGSWPQTRPPVMRTQLMQVGTTFSLTDFDSTVNSKSDANTLFLYPTGVTGTASSVKDTWDFVSRDVRKSATGTPKGTTCSGRLSGGGYACTAILTLPTPVGNPAGDTTRTAFLRLSALYKATHFRVSMIGTKFKAVQPSIDSTGRANDQFRRVESRVDLYNTNFPFPEAAVDVSGNLCKNFLVTEDSNTFSTECTP